jgi:UDP-glucose 4-epimerase
VGERVFVTGGLGFIGSALAEALLNRGDNVTVVDDCSYGTLGSLPKGAQFIAMSAKDMPGLDVTPPSLIFHFGSKSSILHYFKEPVETAYDTVAGWRGVLMYAAKVRARLVMASSATVYGTAPLPQREDGPTYPVNTYSIAKLLCERMTKGSDDTVLLRPFTGYGYGEMNKTWYKSPIGMFLDDVANKRPFTIFGDGTQTRDFVYIDDLVKACLMIADDKFFTGPINIGRGVRSTMNEVANTVAKVTGKDYGRKTAPKFETYVDHMQADTTLFDKVVGIKPISLQEGVERFYERELASVSH